MAVTPEVQVSNVYARHTYQAPAEVRVSSVYTRYAWKGTLEYPIVRAYGWSLDGHDFYAITLGRGFPTLVYDITSGTWATYSTNDTDFFTPRTSLNWEGFIDADQSGEATDVIYGDSQSGLLWRAVPTQNWDEGPTEEAGTTPIYARVQAAINMHSYDAARVSRVYLYGTLWTPYNGSVDVNLSWSDDQGRNYVAGDTQTIPTNNTKFQVQWRSLGSIRQPGRLFQVSDNGLARIDGADVNTDNDEVLGGG